MAEDFAPLLASELLDDGALFRAFGLDRSHSARFSECYGQLPAAQRPRLSPFFDPAWYLRIYEDIGRSGLDPFLHFVTQGVFELRSPHPLISMRLLYDDNRQLFYQEGGCRSLLRILVENRSNPTEYFDVKFYVEQYPQARDHGGGALRHFLDQGGQGWLRPNRFFDPEWYTTRYSDAGADSVEALCHFIEFGDREARSPGPDFDPQWYLRSNPDLSASSTLPLRHYLSAGQREGRQPRDPRLRSAAIREPSDTADGRRDAAAPDGSPAAGG